MFEESKVYMERTPWVDFLPDSAIVRLKKQAKVVMADIIGDSHSVVSGLPPLSSQEIESVEQLRKRYANRWS